VIDDIENLKQANTWLRTRVSILQDTLCEVREERRALEARVKQYDKIILYTWLATAALWAAAFYVLAAR